MREVSLDEKGTPRFKANAIVRWLVDSGKVSLNDIILNASAVGGWPIADQEEFWQMLGYSTSGFEDIDWVRDETKDAIFAAANRLLHPDDYQPGSIGDPLGR